MIVSQSGSLKELRLYRSGIQDFDIVSSSPVDAVFVKKMKTDDGEVWAYKVKPGEKAKWFYAVQWTGNNRSAAGFIRTKKGSFVAVPLGEMPAGARRKYQIFLEKEN